ncbi:50S ribosomal protein L18 [Candidatus Roizmanbacteria bacterium RIFCSPHIGHO2_12_FULL_44_10]|uniref:Large ribosomal subunit protein uL18 n=1 Tax=Candidatus Roizmanbacteria bacterium RIFCSPHIGHO2_12_FULL_44_10 TaxID=1802054 RepID=A0A1F7I8C9_9BACT|nr:MAG: 50S ribosomal protein L18 [Candidatus Roizmanbacteria bacterium RIFCSPHIGHO2_12_FULL_44_10]
MKNRKLIQRERRKLRVRSKIIRQSDFPRLTVHRSNKHIYAQLIDDYKMLTLLAHNDVSIKETVKAMDKARQVGTALAEKIKAKKIKQVVFDRGPYAYNGRIKALVEAVREGGITI